VPDVTNISSALVLTGASRLGAAVPHVRGKVGVARVRGNVAFDVPPAQPGQADMHNYMTRVLAVSEGASGPPPHRKPV
jgi:hypothetical protein